MNNFSDKNLNDESNENFGHISFKNSKTKQLISIFFRSITFFAIAAISGGISGAYFSSRKVSTAFVFPGTYPNSNQEDLNKSVNYQYYTGSKIDASKIVEKVSPGIVGIRAKISNTDTERSGSGIIYKADGFIITSYQMVKDADKIFVNLSNNSSQIQAEIKGYDKRMDLCLLKIEVKNLVTVKFGDSSKVNKGDLAIAIGDESLGMVTEGIICSNNKTVDSIYSDSGNTKLKVFETDATINSQNSGGALCDIDGNIIGINCSSLNFNYNGVQGIFYAIPINDVTKTIDAIMQRGYESRAELGIIGMDVNVNTNGTIVKGVCITEITKDSGAEKAGLKPTDIITGLAGVKITKFEDISAVVNKHNIGEKVPCVVLRNGKTIEVQVVLSETKVSK